MRHRVLVSVKLLETLSRGLFVLACTYGLPLTQAGRFGLTATVIGLLAFAANYERQIDVQRQVAGATPLAIYRRFGETLHFFAHQYVLVLPLGALAFWLTSDWGGYWLAALLLIVVAEHLSNQAYQATLIDDRAFPLMVLAAAKNIGLLLTVVVGSRVDTAAFDVQWVMLAWTLASGLYLITAVATWLRWRAVVPRALVAGETRQSVIEQYRASNLHFVVGLVAVAALQLDRLLVGGTLSLEEIGVYFRNIALSSLAFQFFNIVSFSRVAPSVFSLARAGAHDRSAWLVGMEYRWFALALSLGLGIALAVNAMFDSPAGRYGIEPLYLVLLGSGVLLRAGADYRGLLLLSVGADRSVLRNQAAGVLTGALCLLALAMKFGLLGAFMGALFTHLVYLMLNHWSWRGWLRNRKPSPAA
jgi:hypothetical protein